MATWLAIHFKVLIISIIISNVTLEQINKNVLMIKKELDEIKELLEESNLELRDDVKKSIEESRNRSVSQFKTQKDIEKRFL